MLNAVQKVNKNAFSGITTYLEYLQNKWRKIHSEIGNHCNGIRINDKLSPLSTSLQNGDFIEILTNNSDTPTAPRA